MTNKTTQAKLYEHHERLSSYLKLVALNKTLWDRFKLKIDIALGDWVDVNGIEIRFFEHCIRRHNEETGRSELWSMRTLDKVIDDMSLRASQHAESKSEAEELIEIIGEFLFCVESIFEIGFRKNHKSY